MIMKALLHMAGLENSECIWKIQRKPEVAVTISMTEIFTKPRSLFILVQFVWGGPVGIFKCDSRKEQYLGSVTIQLGQRKDHK